MLLYSRPVSCILGEQSRAQDERLTANSGVIHPPDQTVQVYSPSSPRQLAISEGSDYWLFSVVDHEHLKTFQVIDCKHTSILRSISEKRIPVLTNGVRQTILEELENQEPVSLTTDLWSDHRLHS